MDYNTKHILVPLNPASDLELINIINKSHAFQKSSVFIYWHLFLSGLTLSAPSKLSLVPSLHRILLRHFLIVVRQK